MAKEFTSKEIREIKAETPAEWAGKKLHDVFPDWEDCEKIGSYKTVASNFTDNYVFKVYWKRVYTKVVCNAENKIISFQKQKKHVNSKHFRNAVRAYVDHMESNYATNDLYKNFWNEVGKNDSERGINRYASIIRWFLNTVPEAYTRQQMEVLARCHGLDADDPRIRKMKSEIVSHAFAYVMTDEIIRRHEEAKK